MYMIFSPIIKASIFLVDFPAMFDDLRLLVNEVYITYRVVPQFGIAKLVNISPISLWFTGDIS